MTPRLRSSLLATLLPFGLLAACTGGSDKPVTTTTRLAATAEMIEHDTVCSMFQQYITAEARPIRPTDPNAPDAQDVAKQIEQKRVKQLDLLAQQKMASSTPEVKQALEVLRTLRRDDPTDPRASERAAQLRIVTNKFDPYCDTVGGGQGSKNSTTLPPLTGPTVTLPTSTTPATTATTAK